MLLIDLAVGDYGGMSAGLGMRIVGVVLGALALGGCASVTRGWQDQMQFNSDPPGAEMRTSLGLICLTPCTLQVGRKDEFTATFSKAGFESQQVVVTTRLAPGGAAGFAGNVLVGGVIGMGVDVASGATLDHCPSPVTVTLKPLARGRRADAAPPFQPPECVNQPAPAVASSE